MSIQVEVSTSLPPGSKGPVQGRMQLHIPFINFSKSFEKLKSSTKTIVEVKWPGGEVSSSKFKPCCNGQMSGPLLTVAYYQIRADFKSFKNYLADTGLIKLPVLIKGIAVAETEIDVTKLENKIPLASLCPLVSSSGEIVGNIFISLFLEMDNYTNAQSDLTPQLRKDMNNILQQLTIKAKDLRECLSSVEYLNNQTDKPWFHKKTCLKKENALKIYETQPKISGYVGATSFKDYTLNQVLEFFKENESIGESESSVLDSIFLCQTGQEKQLKKLPVICLKKQVSILEKQRTGEVFTAQSIASQTTKEQQNLDSSSILRLLEDVSFLKICIHTINLQCRDDTFNQKHWSYWVEVNLPWLGLGRIEKWDINGHKKLLENYCYRFSFEREFGRVSVVGKSRTFPVSLNMENLPVKMNRKVEFNLEAKNSKTKETQLIGSIEVCLADVLQSDNLKFDRTELKSSSKIWNVSWKVGISLIKSVKREVKGPENKVSSSCTRKVPVAKDLTFICSLSRAVQTSPISDGNKEQTRNEDNAQLESCKKLKVNLFLKKSLANLKTTH